MTALSFFSYKGGVGRTMALTNLAMKLVEFGKSVFIIDFDLEAPGVPFKLTKYITKNNQIESGVVDYIYEFTSNGKIDTIEKYVKILPNNNPGDASMWLLPAGNSNLDEYWNKLSRINWHNLFYKEGGLGLSFFLDLKEKIQRTYNPDFLLIDSRTGITELSGISLKILADEVVVLFINNDENIKGTEKVLSFLNGNTESNEDNSTKIHLILSRVPHHKKHHLKFNQEYKLISGLKQQFAPFLNGKEPEISVIHTDERLQMNEKLAFSIQLNNDDNSPDIYSEHIGVFEKIFCNQFTPKEWENFQNTVRATKIFDKARFKVDDYYEKINLLTEAILLNPNKWEYFTHRGYAFQNLHNFEKAAKDFKSSYQLSKAPAHYRDYAWALVNLEQYNEAYEIIDNLLSKEFDASAITLKAIILQRQNKFNEALNALNEALPVLKNPHELLNTRADIYRRMNRYDEALADIFKAIEIFPTSFYYGTLAEIYGAMNKIEEFYLNLNTALSRGMTVVHMRTAKDAYDPFRNEPRFIELMKSYNINPKDIFRIGPLTTDDPIDSDDLDDKNGGEDYQP